MGILDRFFRSDLKHSVVTELARSEPGPLTAHEAYQLALSIVAALDNSANLVLIASGNSIQHDGRSLVWEFLFSLERRSAQIMLTFQPDQDAQDADTAPLYVKKRIFGMGSKQRASLPSTFKDSPIAVRELAAAGADFVSGPTDMKIESAISSLGSPVWITYCWDKRYEVSFI